MTKKALKEIDYKTRVAFSRFVALLKGDEKNMWSSSIMYYPSDVFNTWSWHYLDAKGIYTSDREKAVYVWLCGRLKTDDYPVNMTYQLCNL